MSKSYKNYEDAFASLSMLLISVRHFQQLIVGNALPRSVLAPAFSSAFASHRAIFKGMPSPGFHDVDSPPDLPGRAVHTGEVGGDGVTPARGRLVRE